MTSDSILPSIPSKDEAQATLWSWQQTFDRLKRRGTGKIDEIVIPQRLLDLGLDVTYRFGILVRESNVVARHKVDHPILAEIIDNPDHSDEYIAARVNSIFDNRELIAKDKKPVSLSTLISILDGLEPYPGSSSITDHTDRSIYAESRARVKVTLAMVESHMARRDLIREVNGAFVLDPAYTQLTVENPDRAEAIIELVRDRSMRDMSEIKDMMKQGAGINRFMEGML